MRTVIVILASAGFIGYIPAASGTFGSLVGIPLFWVFADLTTTSAALSLAVYAAFVAASCWIAGRAETYFGDHDSHKIVIDEVAGYVAATLFLQPNLRTAVIAFFAFRFFDVVKLSPAREIDRSLPGGAGVVLDDVVAGFYANLATRLVLLMWPFVQA